MTALLPSSFLLQTFPDPPFNDSNWFRKDDDVRWQYGVPPRGNANFAWVQHFIHHLAPLFFWNNRMPQGSLKRGDRQRAARAQAITSAAVGDAIA